VRPRPASKPAFLFAYPLVGKSRMNLQEIVYLRHQQRRFMRPDAVHYLRPDAARFLKPDSEKANVYPALARKWDGQPRLPDGEGEGQYTFGRQSASGLPRVYITRTDGAGEGSGNESGVGLEPSNDLDNSCWPRRSRASGTMRGRRLENLRKFPKRSHRGRRQPSFALLLAGSAAHWVSAWLWMCSRARLMKSSG
jgi:hypothetical protein